MELWRNGDRVAVIAGLRTPFAPRDRDELGLSADELLRLCIPELLARSAVAAEEIDQVVVGRATLERHGQTSARELTVGAGLPLDLEAYSVCRGGATGYQAFVSTTEAMLAGVLDAAVAAGADGEAHVAALLSRWLSDHFGPKTDSAGVRERLLALRERLPQELRTWVAPPPVEGERDLSAEAEALAQREQIPRAEQDELAHRSHALAALAWQEGRFDDEVMRMYTPPRYERVLREDVAVRREPRLEELRRLPPRHDARRGTVTNGNSAALSSGACAVVLMRESLARALGHAPLGVVRSYAFTACPRQEQALLGGAFAAPLALERAGVQLADIDVIDIDEVFAAPVLGVVRALESDAFAEEQLGRNRRVGNVDWDRVNVNGGALAIGHTPSAGGLRQVTQALLELRRRGGALALCMAGAGEGLGAAIVLEAV